MSDFHKEDSVKSFNWLGHGRYGYTELIAFHKDYRPSRENFKNNFEKKLFPKIWYTKKTETVVAFVKRYHQEHTLCYGINPRPKILRTNSGYNRSAKDYDIGSGEVEGACKNVVGKRLKQSGMMWTQL